MNRLFAGVDSSAVSDALDHIGLHSQIATGIGALYPSPRVTGKVMTVELAATNGTPSSRHLGTAAIESLEQDDIIVVANSGLKDVAAWGGNLALAAKRRGAAGIVIDGVTRDLDEIIELELPVFARGATPRTARGRVRERSFGEPIRICGIPVAAGDYVIADRSGVAFIPSRYAKEVAERAAKIMDRDAALSKRIRAGEPVSKVMGAQYEHELKN